MIQSQEISEIQTAPLPSCALCGAGGEFLYQGQQDRLFGADGIWNLKKCPSQDCGLIWLDPMPLADEIGKAYANYYTHKTQAKSSRKQFFKRLYHRIKEGYIANRYGYRVNSGPLTKKLGALLYFFPIRRSGVDQEVRFLPSQTNGRLLDVGCGSGDWLAFMRELGWQVEGIDFDEKAIALAREKKLEVSCGALDQQNYEENSFDAITLNHVIEHVPNPMQTVLECRRLLKPGGRLVIATPNTASLSHYLFGKNWRGLEPPRHLHIFSMRLLGKMLNAAGFKKMSLHSHVAESVIRESLGLLRGSKDSGWTTRLFVKSFTCMESGALMWKPSWGDCVVAVAVK